MENLTAEQIRSALSFCDAEDQETWVMCGMAVKSELGESGKQIWLDWSMLGSTYNQKQALNRWKSFKLNGGTRIGSLIHEAKKWGFKFDANQNKVSKHVVEQRKIQRLEIEKQAEKEYERCKAEYDREKAKLNKLYDQQKATRTEAFQYMKNCCADIYRQSCLFLDILKKYIPDGKQENKSSEPISQQETTEEQQEYFSMKLLSLIHEVCIGEQFEEISAPDFYANMNLHPCNCKLKIKPREKIRVCYLIFLMSEKLSKQDRDKWKDRILKLLDIDDSYYKSKYKEPVSDFPSDSNQNFAKEMEHIFR